MRTMTAHGRILFAVASRSRCDNPIRAGSRDREAAYCGVLRTDATAIQNHKPLVTSKRGSNTECRCGAICGTPLVDWPWYQRLAAPVTVDIEMFTARISNPTCGICMHRLPALMDEHGSSPSNKDR
jgi:hypothetical protein